MKEYTYSVARVRAKEAALLTGQDTEQLINAESYEAALRYLRDRGYRASDAEDTGSVVKAAERDMWEFLEEVADEETMLLMRLPIDYHNIKASVKSVFSGIDGEDLLLPHGTAYAHTLYKCVKSRSYSELENAALADVCEEAMSLILKTQDGQICAVYVDNMLLKAMNDAARSVGDEFLKRYVSVYADTTNLKTALRCAKSGRNLSFIENALSGAGTLNISELARSAEQGESAVCEYVGGTEYSDGAEYMKTSAAAFEKWCGDKIMSLMESARYDSFSRAPLIAYYYAKTTEISAVRMILSGKLNRLDDNMIRERVRETYV